MKKLLAIAAALCIALLLAGCTAESDTPDTCVMRATVTEIDQSAMLVTPEEGSWELSSSDCFSVPIAHMESSPEPQVGDRIEILYGGGICETYPATLEQIISVRVVTE